MKVKYVKDVVWTPEYLSITLVGENEEEKTIIGNCFLPYHPYEFKNAELHYFENGGLIINVKKIAKPNKWDAKGIIEAINKTETYFEYRRDRYNVINEDYWTQNGKKIFEKIFDDDYTNPPFIPVPITRGIRIFTKPHPEDENKTILRIALYFLEEVRVDKWELII
ncbi:hypothetical protein [Methanocaldococcus sp.]|uniref:hypothetical protein n=1 Tax=Methanocaldococcus sp. TaxID=2152917 RepID=UPI00260BEB56|nr:hypothetical protein [Methanocaldococcus sp.]MCQ6254545.1 hypothetical protein [Methanocaldococcus sp.]